MPRTWAGGGGTPGRPPGAAPPGPPTPPGTQCPSCCRVRVPHAATALPARARKLRGLPRPRGPRRAKGHLPRPGPLRRRPGGPRGGGRGGGAGRPLRHGLRGPASPVEPFLPLPRPAGGGDLGPGQCGVSPHWAGPQAGWWWWWWWSQDQRGQWTNSGRQRQTADAGRPAPRTPRWSRGCCCRNGTRAREERVPTFRV